MSPWVRNDAPAEVLDNETCVTCARKVYLAKSRASEGILCVGCGHPQSKCFCPDVREVVHA